MGEIVEGPFMPIYRPPKGNGQRPEASGNPEHVRSLLVSEAAKMMIIGRVGRMLTVDNEAVKREEGWILDMSDEAIVDYLNNEENWSGIRANSARMIVLSKWLRGEI